MISTNELTSIVKLVDDPSPIVQENLRKAILEFGSSLPSILTQYLPELEPEERHALIKLSRRFEIGQKVKHSRYNYRGLVVDFDHTCQAEDQWYQNNSTQPDKEQAWYHVLVHGSSGATYAAQTSLVADVEENKIEHPLIPYFFKDSFEGDLYERNDRPWPKQ